MIRWALLREAVGIGHLLQHADRALLDTALTDGDWARHGAALGASAHQAIRRNAPHLTALLPVAPTAPRPARPPPHNPTPTHIPPRVSLVIVGAVALPIGLRNLAEREPPAEPSTPPPQIYSHLTPKQRASTLLDISCGDVATNWSTLDCTLARVVLVSAGGDGCPKAEDALQALAIGSHADTCLTRALAEVYAEACGPQPRSATMDPP